MKIYTKTGDKGETGLYGGSRVPKDHIRIESYGAVDELNAWLGYVMALLKEKSLAPLKKELHRIQGELFELGAELATPRGKTTKGQLIDQAATLRLEKSIDAMEAKLKPLRNFILPQGSLAVCAMHAARAVSRRAERHITTLHRAEPLRPEVLIYINRMSDYLFVCSRHCARLQKCKEVAWLSK